jgi:hypothetical protein
MRPVRGTRLHEATPVSAVRTVYATVRDITVPLDRWLRGHGGEGFA